MMWRALSADWLKIRGKGLWFLVFLGPIGLLAMQGAELWAALRLSDPAISCRFMGRTAQQCGRLRSGGPLSGGHADLFDDGQRGAPNELVEAAPGIADFPDLCLYGQAAALPAAAYCLLSAAGGGYGGLGSDPRVPIAANPLCEGAANWLCFLCCSTPGDLTAAVVLLSSRNQTFPVSVGITLSLLSIFSLFLSEWVPLSWPALAWSAPRPWLFSGAGLLLGLLILLPGSIHFARKDVD